MTSRLIVRLAPAFVVSALAFSAAAGTKDAAATAKIDEAINVHYLATDFNKAEAQLLGVVKACGKDCSPPVLARAWMYVGLVRGSGKQDIPGAREAFNKAKESDQSVQLDSALATPEVQAEFDAIFGGGAAKGRAAATPAAAPAAAGAPAPAAAAGGDGSLECNVDPGSEIEVRRPIPMSCTAPAGATKAVLAYKEFGGSQFVNLPMTIQEGTAKVAIPCSATKMVGNLAYVILFKDGNGATLGSVGSLEQPGSLSIVQTTIQPPPAYPGEAPPARCAEEVECPPGLPGCSPTGGGGWGDACTPAEPCKKGLFCQSGTCENAPSCESDSDCDSGRCSDGFCEMSDSSSGGGSSGGFKKIWVGLHFAPDVYLFSSAQGVCSIDSLGSHAYSCYELDSAHTPLFNEPDTTPREKWRSGGVPTYVDANRGSEGRGQVNGGPRLATMRILASFDYALTSNFLVGIRAGFAFGGGPKSWTYTSRDATESSITAGKSFFPVHIEPRVTYHFMSLGKGGIHPYVHIGGGMAQVDAKMNVPICNRTAENCLRADGLADTRQVAVYKRLGQGFATVGGGVLYPFGGRFGAQLNLNLMYMLPDSGIVIEPSLGAVVGF